MGVAYLNFVEKTFVGGCKIAKFVKVISLESFQLYGIQIGEFIEALDMQV